jgi:hypothetical protein
MTSRIPGRNVVAPEFEQHRHEVRAPIGIWSFIKVAAAPGRCGLPALVP